MPRISLLDKNVAELIAAGEVVERPASVIKELVENSIDAGAKTVTVEIKNGGITYMRISDDGCGILRSDVATAFLRHATSKISSKDDLDRIMTLGFRGEALASVSAVANVEMLTRSIEEEEGTLYRISGGEEQELSPAGCPVGTTVIVRDLFYNVPARMKFLKKDVTEGNAVAGVIEKLALSHPEVSLRFIRDGKNVLSTSGDGKLRSVVYDVMGRDFASSAVEVKYENGDLRISGFISKPVNSRSNRTMQNFFLNGRYIRSKTCVAAIEEAYKGSIMVGKFPACVLYIDLPAETVDVNVHPSKMEVRFVNERPIFDIVYHGVKNALGSIETAAEISFSRPLISREQITFEREAVKGDQLVMPKPHSEQTFIKISSEDFKEEYVTPLPPSKNNEAFAGINTVLELRGWERTEPVASEEPKIPDVTPPKAETIERVSVIAPEFKEQSETEQEHPVIIGEAFETYIIAQMSDRLLFIDKHAAHERIIYERLKRQGLGGARQMLLCPVTVRLDSREFDAVIKNSERIAQLGFETEQFGENTVIVRTGPSEFEVKDIAGVISEIASNIADHKKDITPELYDDLFHSIACRSAVKAGDRSTTVELERIIDIMAREGDIKYCPHGRPVTVVLTKKEIEKRFGRI